MRLIDADKLKIDMDCNIDFGGLDNRHMILGQIDNALTVEERKVGKWITNPNKMKGTEIECNKCGVSALSKIGIQVCSDFCPNCGAEMRGSNNE